MATVSAPWTQTSDGFTSGSFGQTANGTSVYRTKEDTRSALKRTKQGKWRPPQPYSRVIADGNTPRPWINVRVDYQAGSDPKPRKMTHAGPGVAPTGYTLPPLAFPPDIAIRAEQRALQKLKRQDVNLAVAFGERAATAEMVANTTATVLRALERARRLDVAGVARELKCAVLRSFNPRRHPDGKAASLWLEYQYGWSPLYSDVYGAVSELHNRDTRMDDRYRCTVSGKTEGYDESMIDTTYGVPSGVSSLLQGTAQMRTRVRYRAYCRLDYVLDNPMLATLAELGITNPAEVAWELLPFSFVADWFVPIGSYLSRLDATTGWTFKGGSMSKLTRANREFYVRSVRIASVNAWGQIPSNGSPVSRQTRMQLSRTVYSTSPSAWLPSIWGEKGLAAGNRAANAIALLTSFFR